MRTHRDRGALRYGRARFMAGGAGDPLALHNRGDLPKTASGYRDEHLA
jgi:hypothetical protein